MIPLKTVAGLFLLPDGFPLQFELTHKWDALLDGDVDDVVEVVLQLVELCSLHRPDDFGHLREVFLLQFFKAGLDGDPPINQLRRFRLVDAAQAVHVHIDQFDPLFAQFLWLNPL